MLLLVLSLLVTYLIPDLVTPSMELDGVIYAGIANASAEGYGSFWFPPNFEAASPSFHDHPPVGLWLLAQWFGLLGGAFWVERLFLLLTILGCCGLLAGHWRYLQSSGQLPWSGGSWWPVLIFVLMPVSTSVLKNNPLEALLTLVTLVTVLLAWWVRLSIAGHVLVGLGVLVAIGTKGPVGLFPLVAPMVLAVIGDHGLRRGMLNSLVATITVALVIAGLLLHEDAGTHLSRYWDAQIVASLTGQRQIEHGRFYLLGQLGLNVGVAALVALLPAIWMRRLRLPRVFWVYLCLGLAASLPLLLSPRQYRHYLLPSLPYFAVCLAMIAPPVIERVRATYVQTIVMMVLVVCCWRGFTLFGEPGKDRVKLATAEAIASLGERGAIVFCQPSLDIRAYLFRYQGIASDVSQENESNEGLFICNEPGADNLLLIAILPDGTRAWKRNINLMDDR